MGDKIHPPDFVQLDPKALQDLATKTDEQSYALADQKYAERFPDLTAGRDYTISNAGANLAGQQDPAITGALGQAGLGNINFGNTEFQQAQNLGQPILAKEQRDRSYFANLLKENPARSIGLSSSDISHIALTNSGNKTAFDNAQFGSDINQINANAQTSAQSEAALASGLGTALQSALKYTNQAGGTNSAANSSAYYAPTNYLNPSTYNYQPSGGYYNPGFGASPYGGSYEGDINGNSVYRAEPVSSTYTSSADTGSSSGF